MTVTTQSPKLDKLRKGVMELYISDHPLDCLTCAANGDCELQDAAGQVGLREVRYGYDGDNHLGLEKDTSNPYFDFDSSKCIACSRCVRACEEVQGTFALTISGQGFESRVSAGAGESFFESECVSCGACVQACPTATLQEKSVVDLGMPTRTVLTTCAYCGVGCSFKAELRGSELVRMVPSKDGGANEGHSCVKGRFAFGYASHPDRVLKPLLRESIDQDFREVEWDEAIGFVARRMREIQARYGPGAIGGITSSRTTNEEVYAVQRMIRAAFGNNNVDTCARVCHSPTGYGLGQTFGTSAGTQDFKSVEQADVMLLIGANPTDGHPVFASRMKKRLRQGAQIIVADPRRIDLVHSPHVEAAYHLPLQPGTNVALVNAMAHTIVTEGLVNREFVAERCERFDEWAAFIARPENSAEAAAEICGVPAQDIRGAARLYAAGPNSAIYYGLGVTEHSQGSTMVMAMANLAMCTGNIGREGVGVNPLRGQNNVQGSCDMGSFPHELPGYRHVSDAAVRSIFENLWDVPILPEPGLRIPNMFDAAISGSFKGLFVQGEDIAQSDPNTAHVVSALTSLDLLVTMDLFVNETAKYAHVVLPGTSFLEKDGTFTNAERRINRVRPTMPPKTGKHEWQAVCEIAQAMGYDMHYDNEAQIMDEIAATTPTFAGVSFKLLDEVGSVQWPCNPAAPAGDPGHAHRRVRARQGAAHPHPVRADDRAVHPQVPAAAHHRAHPVAVQRGRADPADRQRGLAPRGRAGDPPGGRGGARHRRRRRGAAVQPDRRDHAARQAERPDADGRRLHHVPPPGVRRQRGDHGELRLGDQLPGVQGHRGAGGAGGRRQARRAGDRRGIGRRRRGPLGTRGTREHQVIGQGGHVGSGASASGRPSGSARDAARTGRAAGQRHRRAVPAPERRRGGDG